MATIIKNKDLGELAEKSKRVWVSGNFYVELCPIALGQDLSELIYFVSDMDGGQYGQFDNEEDAVKFAKTMIEGPNVGDEVQVDGEVGKISCVQLVENMNGVSVLCVEIPLSIPGCFKKMAFHNHKGPNFNPSTSIELKDKNGNCMAFYNEKFQRTA